MDRKSAVEARPVSNKDRRRPGPWPPAIEPFVSKTDHSPHELKSWANRTGFNHNFSGESTLSSIIDEGGEDAAPQGQLAPTPPPPPPGKGVGLDMEKGLGRRLGNRGASKVELEPILGQRRTDADIGPAADLDSELAGLKNVGRKFEKEKRRIGVEPEVGLKEEGRWVGNDLPLRGKGEGKNVNERGNGEPAMTMGSGDGEAKKDEVEIDLIADPPEPQITAPLKSGLMCELTENPGFGRLFLYGIQHYLSLAGSLIFVPLIMVPAMGGTDGETANVIATVLLVSGVTTIMHSFFGTRLPLVQGSSFVYLAPALVIINSEEYRNLSDNKFRHIMRELQGAIIVGSIFQTILGYSGLMSLILRLINPVVVAPTVATIGLAFFSYGFPQAGSCVGISIPLILLILIFTLYLRKISIFGHKIFLVYAVPISVAIVWAYAFFLTTGGAYNYKGCSSNIPSSNILADTCRKHALTMKRCRTDVSVAWKTAAWVRIPYPFQWGAPTFNFRTSIIMAIVSIVASVDSIGSYHATSLLINLRPPTPGVVSRGIGLEGLSGILAGLWGTGTSSSTLTENIHTLDATKMASRKALSFGAVFLILFSFVGKVGALIASIPLALAAAVLCFTWALIVALGLSTMQYTQSACSRNMLIVGFTLFISLSIPAYFQQYPSSSTLILPSYLVPYAAASDGPINTGSKGLNYALNSLLSLNMVVALLVAFILDNTVPGSKQERGTYIWSSSRNSDVDPSSMVPYLLPKKVGCLFRWAKWVGS
ncbi:nucleobase-ascorbate transporter 11 isoform X1 [Dendrobium catenatum]|uniref:nucleobase-ascorbate transporter 11 isoform X1 n=1 Tax=Dendrobium catenatum TaxID=906689 RepID=UPI00109FEAA0|nr:nucleobase-ascorbate transporter 11 isoform X1 [Dendrobium catenatum]XP_028549842.1 nucleobase-ascorbate transporter 11 isoform X1 [Dendrobium catenatum]